MSHLTIRICTDNDAFANSHGQEVAKILHGLADEFEEANLLNPDGERGSLMDSNGNRCGGYVVD
jgi:hypothetical protein